MSQRLKVHFMSETDEWATPQFLFDALNAEFGFTLDPCATAENAKCKRFYTKVEDGLRQDWKEEVVFMNPPYGRQIGVWMRKAYESSRAGTLVVCLVPARTDTSWWHRYAMRGEVRFFKGRLRFGNGLNSAPFPSAVVVFRPYLLHTGR
jgi:phage N-6-adenine-methyltransferase